jgi:hypothetical protein
MLLIKNPPWLYSLFDKVFFGREPQIEQSPNISIRASPAKVQKSAGSIELMQCAVMPDLQESCIPDGNDSQNNEMDSGHKTPLYAG